MKAVIFLVLFGDCFQASGADLLLFSVNFLDLKIDLEFSKGFDIGMADLVPGSRSSPANIAYSTHVFLYEIRIIYEYTNIRIILLSFSYFRTFVLNL